MDPIPENAKLAWQMIVVGTYAAVGGITQQTINVLNFIRTTVTDPADKAAMMTAWEALVKADWLAATSVSWTMDTLRLRCLNDATDPYADLAIGDPGTIIGDPLPAWTAMLISRHSTLRGRRYQGRSYIAGIPESGSDGNALTAGQLALLTTLADLFNDPVVAGTNTYIPAIFSPSEPTWIKTNPTNVVITPQSSTEAKSLIAVMRSRKSRAVGA